LAQPLVAQNLAELKKRQKTRYSGHQNSRLSRNMANWTKQRPFPTMGVVGSKQQMVDGANGCVWADASQSCTTLVLVGRLCLMVDGICGLMKVNPRSIDCRNRCRSYTYGKASLMELLSRCCGESPRRQRGGGEMLPHTGSP
jgi:hypothetical protein